MPAAQWAQNEFGFAQLGDVRRNKRLVKIAENLATNPGGTLPQAFPEWAELKAAYRFFEQEGVGFQQIVAPHVERTRAACREPGEYLIIEDTTLLDYSNRPAAEGLGQIGDGRQRGLELHSALAVRVESWTLEQRPEGTLMGLFGQSCCSPRATPAQETRGQRLRRPRKSQRWAQAFKTAGPVPPASQWIYIADRESDCYEPMRLCQQHGVDFVIRACQNRRLAEQTGYLWEKVQKAPVIGQATVELRARAGQAARKAIVQMSAVRVALDAPWRPGGKQPPLGEMTAVLVNEPSPPEGIEPLCWMLLTSLPCETIAQLQRVVGRYAARWWIEEYHKALKSGTGVEDSQLEKAHRLEALIAVLAVVAVRLLGTKMLARSRPEGSETLLSFGPEMVALLEKKYGIPQRGWTNENVLIAIARLGGFLARKHDGLPGWQTIWRGWQRLIWMCAGVNLIHA